MDDEYVTDSNKIDDTLNSDNTDTEKSYDFKNHNNSNKKDLSSQKILNIDTPD